VADQRFAAGSLVRVLDLPVNGHMRTPHFVRGRQGSIDRFQGRFPDPETRAYGRDGLPPKALYLVRFRQKDLWPHYKGDAGDTIAVDIFEHWLSPAGDSTGASHDT
jgi:hypothetical protein